MGGWIFDIGWLKSIRPDWVTMKFTTAFSFFFSGIVLYFTASLRFGRSSYAFVIMPACLLCISLTMFTLLASTMFDINVGIETLFVTEASGAVETVLPGRPSLAAMLNFMMMVCAGIVAMLNAGHLPRLLFCIGCLVCLIGMIAVAGYIADWPALYYYVEGGISTAMALHSAILFMILGYGLIRLR